MIRSATRAISSRPKTPTTWSTSGTSSSSISFCRSARQPATITPLICARPLALEHLPDHAERLLPRRVDEPAGIDDHQVGRLRVRDERVAVLGQQPEHPLGIDQVLGAAQADERDRRCFRYRWFRHERFRQLANLG